MARESSPRPRCRSHDRYGRQVVGWDDVAEFAAGLPEVEEGTSWGHRCWKVKGKTFVWVRPLRAKELDELGDARPAGEVAGVRVADAADKQAVLDTFDGVFTIEHFANYDAVLIDLGAARPATVEELIVDAWLCMAPPELAARYAAEHGLGND